MSTYKPNDLLFIDRLNFTMLQDKSFNLDDIITLLSLDYSYNAQQHEHASKIRDKVSLMTQSYLTTVNNKIHQVLFDRNSYLTSISNKLSHQDIDYINAKMSQFLFKSEESDCDCICANPVETPNKDIDYKDYKKYYEIISTDSTINNYTLVVVEEEFLSNLTACKEELVKFLLDCLSHQYKTGYDLYTVLKLYLSLKVNEGYFDLIKLRAS